MLSYLSTEIPSQHILHPTLQSQRIATVSSGAMSPLEAIKRSCLALLDLQITLHSNEMDDLRSLLACNGYILPFFTDQTSKDALLTSAVPSTTILYPEAIKKFDVLITSKPLIDFIEFIHSSPKRMTSFSTAVQTVCLTRLTSCLFFLFQAEVQNSAMWVSRCEVVNQSAGAKLGENVMKTIVKELMSSVRIEREIVARQNLEIQLNLLYSRNQGLKARIKELESNFKRVGAFKNSSNDEIHRLRVLELEDKNQRNTNLKSKEEEKQRSIIPSFDENSKSKVFNVLKSSQIINEKSKLQTHIEETNSNEVGGRRIFRRDNRRSDSNLRSQQIRNASFANNTYDQRNSVPDVAELSKHFPGPTNDFRLVSNKELKATLSETITPPLFSPQISPVLSNGHDSSLSGATLNSQQNCFSAASSSSNSSGGGKESNVASSIKSFKKKSLDQSLTESLPKIQNDNSITTDKPPTIEIAAPKNRRSGGSKVSSCIIDSTDESDEEAENDSSSSDCESAVTDVPRKRYMPGTPRERRLSDSNLVKPSEVSTDRFLAVVSARSPSRAAAVLSRPQSTPFGEKKEVGFDLGASLKVGGGTPPRATPRLSNIDVVASDDDGGKQSPVVYNYLKGRKEVEGLLSKTKKDKKWKLGWKK